MPGIKSCILIVEDDESVRTSFAEVFNYLGYRTRCAADGLAALIEIPLSPALVFPLSNSTTERGNKGGTQVRRLDESSFFYDWMSNSQWA